MAPLIELAVYLYLYICCSIASITSSICKAILAEMVSSIVPQKLQPAAGSSWIPSFLSPHSPPPPRGLDWAKSVAASWLPSAFTKPTTATGIWQMLRLLRSEYVVALSLVVGVITAGIHIWVLWAYTSRPSGPAETEEEEEEEHVYRPYQTFAKTEEEEDEDEYVYRPHRRAATTIEDGIIKTKSGATHRSTTYRYAGEKEASSEPVRSRLPHFAGGVWQLARVAMRSRTDLLGPTVALSTLSTAAISLVAIGGSLSVAFSLYQCALFGAPFLYLMW